MLAFDGVSLIRGLQLRGFQVSMAGPILTIDPGNELTLADRALISRDWWRIVQYFSQVGDALPVEA